MIDKGPVANLPPAMTFRGWIDTIIRKMNDAGGEFAENQEIVDVSRML